MGKKSRFKLSLANKCRMLFGLAVLLIIAAALSVPGYRMDGLLHELNIRTIKQMALAAHAHCDLPGGKWDIKQADLDKWWPIHAGQHQLPAAPVPKLIKIDPLSKTLPEGLSTFLQRSIQFMRERVDVDEAVDWGFEPDGRAIYRFALAVRRNDDQKLVGIVTAWFKPRDTMAELWWNRGTLIAAGGLAGLLALLVFYLISQKLILSPVRELRRVSGQVASGDLSVRSQTATGDEFEDLARDFNVMLSHLQATQDELRAVNRSLDVKLDHLAHANVGLFESNRLKSEFLANVSHELRTPMSSIIGFAELLKEAHENGDPRLVRYAQNILTSGRMLLEIINDLLDLAKIEAGKTSLRTESVDVAAICRDLMDLVRPLAANEGLGLELDLADQVPPMESDGGKIKQILYNLLSNAIKFTPEGGRIVLAAAPEGSQSIRLAVTDTGPGIPAEELETIFEKFRQIDQSKTREYSGTGLGLAISRELASILGGTVTATSELGVGSTFAAVLPLHAPSEPDGATAAPVGVHTGAEEE